MDYIHIYVLICLSIFLLAFYFILRVHYKNSQIADSEDFISNFMRNKANTLRHDNINLKVDTYTKIGILAPLVLGILTYLGTQNGLVSVIIGLSGFLVPEAIVQYIKYDRNKKFEERYARSLEQLSSSLRAGLSIAQAVEDVAECKFVHESMREKYAKLSSDLQMGLTVSESFQRFAEGTNNQDAEDVALAIDVQNIVGGHEAEVIQEIAEDIRDRIMLRREIKSIFSSTSSMIWMMDVIAPGVIVWFLFANQNYVAVYFSTPLFLAIFVTFLALVVVGIIINHRTLRKVRKGA